MATILFLITNLTIIEITCNPNYKKPIPNPPKSYHNKRKW
ncbi:hypothetical protein GLYMA_05G175051v4 [Glycine max]|nr:hypothetical protein GLYMA_05G175051v4 [Glycine max]KAH1134924.1 hypothetical protein GYH30_012979 [Glycine max]